MNLSYRFPLIPRCPVKRGIYNTVPCCTRVGGCVRCGIPLEYEDLTSCGGCVGNDGCDVGCEDRDLKAVLNTAMKVSRFLTIAS